MADDLYIELLRYGRENMEQGVNEEATLSHLHNLYPEAAVVRSPRSFQPLFDQVFERMSGSATRSFAFKMEGYFHLLQHEELNEARQSSSKALRFAFIALCITGLLSAVSIFVQLAPSVWLPWTGH